MQWVGLLSPEATIAATDDGRVTDAAHWPDRETFAQLPDPGPDESGVLSATAAAVFHAGVMAELIESGTPWAGPVHYHGCTDFQRADEMLRPGFGCHASGAHAYAQQVALHVLQLRWADVEAIAAELLRTGRWQARSAKKSSVKIVKIYQARLLQLQYSCHYFLIGLHYRAQVFPACCSAVLAGVHLLHLRHLALQPAFTVSERVAIADAVAERLGQRHGVDRDGPNP